MHVEKWNEHSFSGLSFCFLYHLLQANVQPITRLHVNKHQQRIPLWCKFEDEDTILSLQSVKQPSFVCLSLNQVSILDWKFDYIHLCKGVWIIAAYKKPEAYSILLLQLVSSDPNFTVKKILHLNVGVFTLLLLTLLNWWIDLSCEGIYFLGKFFINVHSLTLFLCTQLSLIILAIFVIIIEFQSKGGKVHGGY